MYVPRNQQLELDATDWEPHDFSLRLTLAPFVPYETTTVGQNDRSRVLFVAKPRKVYQPHLVLDRGLPRPGVRAVLFLMTISGQRLDLEELPIPSKSPTSFHKEIHSYSIPPSVRMKDHEITFVVKSSNQKMNLSLALSRHLLRHPCNCSLSTTKDFVFNKP